MRTDCRIARMKFVPLRLAGFCLAGLTAALLAATSAGAIVYTYEKATAGAIPELGSDIGCNGSASLVTAPSQRRGERV